MNGAIREKRKHGVDDQELQTSLVNVAEQKQRKRRDSQKSRLESSQQGQNEDIRNPGTIDAAQAEKQTELGEDRSRLTKNEEVGWYNDKEVAHHYSRVKKKELLQDIG